MTSLIFQTGKGNKYRKISIVKRIQVIGRRRCQGLIGLHNFSGTDWDKKFVGISKMRWVREHLKLSDDDPAIRCFGELGNNSLSLELVGRELPEQVRPLEQFVCSVYSPKGPASLPALRCEMFC